MSKLRSIGRFALLGLIALLLGLPAPPQAALAHPADVYLQASYITVTPAQIAVELHLTPGVLVAPHVLPQLDTDGDQQFSDAEGHAYAAALLRDLVLQLDGTPLALRVTKVGLPSYLDTEAGYGTIRLFMVASLAAGTTGTHQIVYTNNYAPVGSAYQVNAVVDTSGAIRLGKPHRDSTRQRLTLDYTSDSAAPALALLEGTAATTTTVGTTGAARLAGAPAAAPEEARRLLAYLYAPTRSPWVLLLALTLAALLGGLHALTPGHGKTLVAAYLVGSRGTVRHAVVLGTIVTFTHTASVIVIGLLALFASQLVVPNVLVPFLELLSGLLVVFIGGRLVWQRSIAFRRQRSLAHDHSHDHPGDHLHDTHAHGDGHVHAHRPPAEGFRRSSLVAMGVSGGLVPCPEALGVMVIAIGLNRVLLGLGLIVSFSFGLAAVLIAIGILLVRSRSLLERFSGIGSHWRSAVLLASAVIVTALGVGMILSSLTTYLA